MPDKYLHTHVRAECTAAGANNRYRMVASTGVDDSMMFGRAWRLDSLGPPSLVVAAARHVGKSMLHALHAELLSATSTRRKRMSAAPGRLHGRLMLHDCRTFWSSTRPSYDTPHSAAGAWAPVLHFTTLFKGILCLLRKQSSNTITHGKGAAWGDRKGRWKAFRLRLRHVCRHAHWGAGSAAADGLPGAQAALIHASRPRQPSDAYGICVGSDGAGSY
jgi:hypothetical protein